MTPKCSIVISAYKDTQSLDLILESLSKQTHLPNGVMVSEDGNCEEIKGCVKEVLKKYGNLAINRFGKYEL